jgi:phosphocarrier protein
MGQTVPTARATANICNTRGLHARASAKFVKLASSFEAEIQVPGAKFISPLRR